MAARTSGTAAAYRRFAEVEARGRSPLYEALALGVAGDADLLALLDALPAPKRQPNLLLASVRHVARAVPPDWPSFRAIATTRWPEVRATMLARSTQTNEPGRCAALLPLLAALPQPLALIEVGASAGLCLLPDRYVYDFGRGGLVRGPAAPADAPAFPCRVNAATPVPAVPPAVAWRAGLDLNPLDTRDADAMEWLETLVWPGQAKRAERLAAAVRVARADPPRVVRGDLRGGLRALAAEAPRGATLVVFHTAVLAYVPDIGEREAFAETVGGLCDHWISNEAPGVLPAVAARAPAPPPPDRFVLALDGVPVAWSDPHGAALTWIGTPGGG